MKSSSRANFQLFGSEGSSNSDVNDLQCKQPFEEPSEPEIQKLVREELFITGDLYAGGPLTPLTLSFSEFNILNTRSIFSLQVEDNVIMANYDCGFVLF
ncbi:unnamed protein product [Cuscuta campestris]|uniref:Uncharacterized protein n=1 Tax=Cuscuta campestris TaxID=132261 RepID=A0A484N3L0_9ASTE|nr:unnamed protein product [Cuscuta campestris]